MLPEMAGRSALPQMKSPTGSAAPSPRHAELPGVQDSSELTCIVPLIRSSPSRSAAAAEREVKPRGAPCSILWLLRFPPYGEPHVKAEAAARGIDPSRIIFTDVAAKPIHIARSGEGAAATILFQYSRLRISRSDGLLQTDHRVMWPELGCDHCSMLNEPIDDPWGDC